MKTKFAIQPIVLALIAANGQFAFADDNKTAKIEELTVVGKSVSYANNAVTQEMLDQQSNITSVMAVIDNLPGVLINEGDTFGTDDWSTTVSIRGFQLSLDEQQIGLTADGIPNGNSNYGGGAKANRYIDTENLAGADVSQGTADIASRSHEALGGTINFTTINPGQEEKLVVSYTTGDFDAQKYYARYETGEIFSNTYAWISASSASNSDWVDEVAENTRDHLAVKFISDISGVSLTGYLSYDDTHEDNYQRLYSIAEFKQNPEWDRLNGDWTGIPYVDQVYRRGWSTLRENLLAYLKADFNVGGIDFSTNVYYHENEGRGDWLPPYVVNTSDGTLTRFIDSTGNPMSPVDGCASSIAFPYGGAGPEADPACHPGGTPVGSYRHTHYQKERFGINGDFSWSVDLDGMTNTLRGGFWYEDYQREEYRDWHQIIDSQSSFRFDHTAYWTQYDREYPVDTLMYYLEDELTAGPVTARIGVKQFDVELERKDKFGVEDAVKVNSDSDALFSAGIVVQTPVEGLEVFAGYAENFAAIKDEVLERDASALDNIEPETAENIDLGLRYENDTLSTSLTYYTIEFDNRLSFLAPGSGGAGIDFLVGTNGIYRNVGGIESEGIEASATYLINDNWSVFTSLTINDSEYSGTGSLASDVSLEVVPGDTVYGSVEEMAVLSLDWSKGNYVAGLSTKWVGDRWMSPEHFWTDIEFDENGVIVSADKSNENSDNRRIDAYIVSDFYVGVTVPMSGDIQELSVRATVNNIFDESYLAGTSGGGAWIGAPRTAAISVSASF